MITKPRNTNPDLISNVMKPKTRVNTKNVPSGSRTDFGERDPRHIIRICPACFAERGLTVLSQPGITHDSYLCAICGKLMRTLGKYEEEDDN